MNKIYYLLTAGLACLACAVSQAAVSVTDDLGQTITLNRPAQRIVTLAPHVTELMFAAGAGDKIVATVKYSDYPEAAKTIPRIGDLRQLDIERILATKPDLLVVWMHGAFDRQLDLLKQAGVPFFFSEPHSLEQIPETLIKLGRLAGTENKAEAAAAGFRQQLQQLRSQQQNKPLVKLFYQVWGKPLYTLNQKHIVNDAIHLCGGSNIFAKLETAAPVVSVEAVLKENPELIISADVKTQEGAGLNLWKGFPTLLATKNHNLFAIDGDLLNRPGPRIIDGARAICEALDSARAHRIAPAEPVTQKNSKP